MAEDLSWVDHPANLRGTAALLRCISDQSLMHAAEIERLQAQVKHAKAVISDLEYHWIGTPEDLWGPLRDPR